MFFGRVAERETVRQRLFAGTHTAVVGPSKMGVSSLLRQVAAAPTLTDTAVIAYVDMSDVASQSPDGLSLSLWAQWWSKIRPGYLPEITGSNELDRVVRRLARDGHKLVAILDEAEQLLWRPRQFDSTFHSRLEALVRDEVVTLVTGTHTPPAQLFQTAGLPSTIYERLVQLDIGLLNRTDALALLATSVTRLGLTMPDGEADYFTDLAGPHPLFLQLVGTYLFAALDANQYDRLRVEQQFRAAAEPYWQELWSTLPPLARGTLSLKGVAADRTFTERQARSLSRKGIVTGAGRDARLFSRGFAEWSETMQRATHLAREATATP